MSEQSVGFSHQQTDITILRASSVCAQQTALLLLQSSIKKMMMMWARRDETELMIKL